jgi:pyridoxamine 5'-phosphate oxidase
MKFIRSTSVERRDYGQSALSKQILKDNPFDQFREWFDDAMQGGFIDPNGIFLCTASADGRPSCRVVLLKYFDNNGFVFFTNYESRKGRDIAENPQATMLCYWDKFERQIRVEGRVEKISQEETAEYFNTRSYTSRLGAWASQQSRPLKSRFRLIREVAKYVMKYPGNVPVPPHWGGYRIVPDVFEFWQGRESRLHDRFEFRLADDGLWHVQRLYP